MYYATCYNCNQLAKKGTVLVTTIENKPAYFHKSPKDCTVGQEDDETDGPLRGREMDVEQLSEFLGKAERQKQFAGSPVMGGVFTDDKASMGLEDFFEM